MRHGIHDPHMSFFLHLYYGDEDPWALGFNKELESWVCPSRMGETGQVIPFIKAFYFLALNHKQQGWTQTSLHSYSLYFQFHIYPTEKPNSYQL